MILTIYSFALYVCFWLAILLLENKALGLPGRLNLAANSYPFLAFNILYILILPLLIVAVANFLFKKKLFQKLFFSSGAIVFILLYQAHLFLVIYRLKNWGTFDWSFFWFNRGEALLTLFRVYGFYAWLFFVVLPVILYCFFLFVVSRLKPILSHPRQKKFFYRIIFFNYK